MPAQPLKISFLNFLEKKQYFLPKRDHIGASWFWLVVTGQKRFPKKHEVKQCKPFWPQNFTWITFNELMQREEVKCFFYVKNHVKPDFNYVFTVLYSFLDDFSKIVDSELTAKMNTMQQTNIFVFMKEMKLNHTKFVQKMEIFTLEWLKKQEEKKRV